MPELRIDDLTVAYERAGYVVKAIDSMTWRADDGQLVLLLGPSGSGKTTLLSVLSGILRPSSGTVRLDGTDVTALDGSAMDRYRRSQVGIVFQAFNLIPSLTALENVATPINMAGTPMRRARARATELLDMVGLRERMNHRPDELSGGQQQRVAIARGLALDPPLIVADEPTAHLDYMQVEGVLRVLRRLASPGRIVVVATHDDRMVPLADQVIELASRWGEPSRPPEELTYAAGDVIFEQGSRGELIYFVESGGVDIVRGSEPEEYLATVQAGEYFGELGPLLGFPRTATARAATDTVLTGYVVHDFKQRAAVDPRVSELLGAAGRAVATPPTRAMAAKRSPTTSTRERSSKAKARAKDASAGPSTRVRSTARRKKASSRTQTKRGSPAGTR